MGATEFIFWVCIGILIYYNARILDVLEEIRDETKRRK